MSILFKRYITFFIFIFCDLHAASADIITQKFSFNSIDIKVDELSTVPYPFTYIDNPKLLLITHSSLYWDSQKITWKAIENLTQQFNNHQFPLFYLADIQDRGQLKASSNILLPKGINPLANIYPYQGDSHRIITATKDVVITGGNFTICACNTVRSLIVFSLSKELRIHYATDGIYEGISGKQLTLYDLTKSMNNDEFLLYLKTSYFNVDTLPCKDPTLLINNKSYTYQIYRNGLYLGQIGKKSTTSGQIELHFDLHSNIIKNLF